MIYRRFYFVIGIGLLLLAGCKSNTEVSTDDTTEAAADSAVLPKDSFDHIAHRENREELAALAEEWNNAFSMTGIAGLPAFYADEIIYFGKVLTRDELVQLKKDYLAANPDIEKSTLTGVAVEPFPNGSSRVLFSRSEQKKKGVSTSNGYVVFQQINGNWKITTESNMEFDAKRILTASQPLDVAEITSCDKAAEAIFRSSPMVHAALHAPNATYKIEYRPGDPDNPNRRYWFWVFGSPVPGGHTDTYGRFQVDPQTGELFNFDAIQDKTTPAPYDEKLKKYIRKYCGK